MMNRAHYKCWIRELKIFSLLFFIKTTQSNPVGLVLKTIVDCISTRASIEIKCGAQFVLLLCLCYNPSHYALCKFIIHNIINNVIYTYTFPSLYYHREEGVRLPSHWLLSCLLLWMWCKFFFYVRICLTVQRVSLLWTCKTREFDMRKFEIKFELNILYVRGTEAFVSENPLQYI